jgi:hypothetical protein
MNAGRHQFGSGNVKMEVLVHGSVGWKFLHGINAILSPTQTENAPDQGRRGPGQKDSTLCFAQFSLEFQADFHGARVMGKAERREPGGSMRLRRACSPPFFKWRSGGFFGNDFKSFSSFCRKTLFFPGFTL